MSEGHPSWQGTALFPAFMGGRESDASSPLPEDGCGLLAGADEAGRGALAGPLVAAAVILPRGRTIPGLRDSKALTPARRESLYTEIARIAVAWSWSCLSPSEVDELGIQEANRRALREAVLGLDPLPEMVMVDWLEIPGLGIPQRGLAKGDRLVPCISAASVVAKVVRDRLMRHLDLLFPGYGFSRHKGYATAEHLKALRQRGPSPLHRLSYVPVGQASLEI